MTSGERMVWAVAFDATLRGGGDAIDAAQAAAYRVVEMESARAAAKLDPEILNDSARRMLDDMLSNGGDR